MVRATLLGVLTLTSCSKEDPAAPGGGTDDDADDADDGDRAGKQDAGPATRDAGGKTDTGTAKPDAATPKPSVDAATPPAGDAGLAASPDGTIIPTADAGPSVPSAFPSVSDSLAKGPFTAKTISSTGPNNNYTVYLPTELGRDGLKHPVLTWGNGGSTQPSWYPMLPHLATHGFVVVAANTIPSIGAEVPLGMDMMKGLEWVLAENERSGSEYFGKVDTTRLAPFGYSMGGLATFTIVGDPRWTTSLCISGGNMANNASIVSKIRVPSLWLCGENDVAGPFCQDDFDAVTTQPVMYGEMLGEDHLGILAGEWADRIRGTVTAWMRWKLMDDAAFAPRFAGPDCELCKDPKYKVQKKNLD